MQRHHENTRRGLWGCMGSKMENRRTEVFTVFTVFGADPPHRVFFSEASSHLKRNSHKKQKSRTEERTHRDSSPGPSRLPYPHIKHINILSVKLARLHSLAGRRHCLWAVAEPRVRPDNVMTKNTEIVRGDANSVCQHENVFFTQVSEY